MKKLTLKVHTYPPRLEISKIIFLYCGIFCLIVIGFRFFTTNPTYSQQRNGEKVSDHSSPSEVELTIRMPSNAKYVERLFCWILRSAVVFWDLKRYGRILLILDGDAKDSNDKLKRALDNIKHSLLDFRYVYETPPKNKKG